MQLILPLLVLLAVFMFLATRRQKREAKALQDLQSALAVGDVVMTTSGLHGTITDLREDTVDLEIAAGVVTTWNRLAVRQLVTEDPLDPETDQLDDDADTPAHTDAEARAEPSATTPRLSKD